MEPRWGGSRWPCPERSFPGGAKDIDVPGGHRGGGRGGRTADQSKAVGRAGFFKGEGEKVGRGVAFCFFWLLPCSK